METIGASWWKSLSQVDKTKSIIDCTQLCERLNIKSTSIYKLARLEFHCRRLLFNLHSERYRLLTDIKNKEKLERQHKTAATVTSYVKIPDRKRNRNSQARVTGRQHKLKSLTYQVRLSDSGR